MYSEATKNVIVVPPHYEGTSFSDIIFALKKTVRKNHFPIKFVGEMQPLPNKIPFGQLDDKSFTQKSLGVMQTLLAFPDSTNFLFVDLYTLGLDALLYSRSQAQMHTSRYGALVHGGTFLSDDLYSWSWLPPYEHAWASSMDKLYVPSQHLYRQLPKEWMGRARVFSWGMDGIQTVYRQKKTVYDVVFPHRLDDDKGAQTLIDIVRKLPKISFVLTTPQSRMHTLANPYAKKLLSFRNVKILTGLNSIA